MARSALTAQEKTEVWRQYRAGASVRSISRHLGRPIDSLRHLIALTGGRFPLVPRRSALRLSVAEREEISRGLVAGESCRLIGRRLGRSASTVSREVTINGGRLGYRACMADQAAQGRACRPKPAKLSTSPRLRAIVERLAEGADPLPAYSPDGPTLTRGATAQRARATSRSD